MKRELPGGFEVDDVFCAHGDRINPVPVILEKIDVEAVHDFVSNRSYWAPGRPREEQERLVADAHRLYEKFGFGPPSERVMERPRRKEGA